MEKNFYRDNFEQLLKDTTDSFRMYPSKRVWHSIYNDLHPSRKWPSIAVWLLLISALAFIGISNNSQSVSVTNTANKLMASAGQPAAKNTMTASTGTIAVETENSLQANNNYVSEQNRNNINGTKYEQTVMNNTAATTLQKNVNSGTSGKHNTKEKNQLSRAIQGNELTGTDSKPENKITPDPGFDLNSLITKSKTLVDKSADLSVSTVIKKELNNIREANKDENTTEKEWMEDFAFHNKPIKSKWKSKASYAFYVTPSIGYRAVSKNNVYSPVVNTSFISSSPTRELNYENAVSQAPAVNMELGGTVLYNISKIVNLKIGVQFNYTNYNVNAYELKHPSVTTLLLNDINTGLPVLSSRSTSLANTSGVYSTKLNNNTYQLSVPLGADIKIAGNNNLHWYAGATLQPSYITGGNAYLISSDMKNYVTDNSLMRKWNLNGGIETFVSYKTKSGITLNAGPQLRYQLLSTYSKVYTYDEKLYNFGLKIGISKRF